ncbi:MAG: zf-HC2 domain-containing protein [Candidatus Rokubacteria bacterium]|nr:zf-HC2 domain-containing protein [Candidatus Rokubacteria bacterium]
MTCDETRERFSDLVDGRLAPDERAALDAHLAACAVCPAELDRLRATVALLRSIEPARAPAGFVDRVVAAARPQPWWRRLAAQALFPLPVKLPLEAAAILLVGVGVAYLFQRTPELRDATRVDAPVVAERPASAPPVTPSGPTPTQPRERDTTAPARAPEPVAPSSDAVRAAKEAPREAPPTRRQPDAATELRSERARPDAEPPPVPQTADAKRRSAPAPTPQAAESKRDAPSAPAPDTRAKTEVAPAAPTPQRAPATATPSADPVPGAPPVAGARAPRAMAKAAPAFDAAGTLAVPARAAGEQAVRDLVARHRGQVTTRVEPAATVLELTMPGAEYPGFVAGLAALGRWQPEREPAEVRPEVRVLLRLVE